MSAVVRLRESIYGDRSSWSLEVWRNGEPDGPPSSYPDRSTARGAAGALAKRIGAVVILAGPDPTLALVPDDDLPF